MVQGTHATGKRGPLVQPLVWRMAGQAGRDLELYCDEAVVEGQDNGFRRRYGQVLLQASSGGVTAALTTRLGARR